MTTPNDLPSVGTEDATGLNIELQIIAGFMHDPRPRSAINRATELLRALVSERDELASRVGELEAEVLDQCRLNGMGAERESALMGRVRELEGERDRLTLSRIDRECLRIGQEIQRAASELPDGYEMEIEIERGSGSVYLSKPDYSKVSFHDMVDGMSYAITSAIDAALNASKEHP